MHCLDYCEKLKPRLMASYEKRLAELEKQEAAAAAAAAASSSSDESKSSPGVVRFYLWKFFYSAFSLVCVCFFFISISTQIIIATPQMHKRPKRRPNIASSIVRSCSPYSSRATRSVLPNSKSRRKRPMPRRRRLLPPHRATNRRVRCRGWYVALPPAAADPFVFVDFSIFFYIYFANASVTKCGYFRVRKQLLTTVSQTRDGPYEAEPCAMLVWWWL